MRSSEVQALRLQVGVHHVLRLRHGLDGGKNGLLLRLSDVLALLPVEHRVGSGERDPLEFPGHRLHIVLPNPLAGLPVHQNGAPEDDLGVFVFTRELPAAFHLGDVEIADVLAPVTHRRSHLPIG